MKRLVGRTIAVTLAAGLVAVPSVASGSGPEAKLVWGDCPADLAEPYPHLTCATIEVPVNYARPGGPKLSVMLSRAPATNPAKRRGVLLVNNGGPGGVATATAGALTKRSANGEARIPDAVLDSYDIIGFDPRGIGHSAPITCVDPEFWRGPQPDLDSPAQRARLWQRSEEFTQGCAETAGGLLPYLGTVNVARDMEQIRTALGEPKLNYFGVRWGTYLATIYTTLFPGRMDRMILDSMFNSIPVDMGYQNSLAQVRPFYERRDEWFDWIARYDGVFHLGTTRADVRKAWDYVAAELRRAPAGEVGPSEFILTTLGAIVGEGQWIPMAQAISDFVNKHDDTRLRAMATPPVSPELANGYAASGVSCLDSAWPTNRATYEADYGSLQAEAPFIGWYMMWLTAHCSNWPAPSATRIPPDGRGLPPFLIVANRNDPGAVYEDVVKLHQIYSSSRLVTAGGSQISETFNPVAERNPYVDQIAADYLVSGILPVRDVTVPGHPLPDPTRTR